MCGTEISDVGAGRCSPDVVEFVYELLLLLFRSTDLRMLRTQGNFRGLVETIQVISKRHGHDSYFRGRTRFTPKLAGPKSYFSALTQQVQR